MQEYTPRIADRILSRKLQGKGAVLIEGAKWCGKTTTAAQQARSIIYIQDPAKVKQNIEMADINPQLLLQGETPRLIDEWQIAPKLWDAVRFEVDNRDSFGQFIMTGSAVPPDFKDIHHSGTGRIARMLMRPMSLWESRESSGEVSLSELFKGKISIGGASSHDINKIAYLICRGGWPKIMECEEDIALEQAIDYFDAVVNLDMSRADRIAHNVDKISRFMRSYSRAIGSQAKIPTMTADLVPNDSTLSDVTVAGYINTLKKIFVIEDAPAWNPNLRSKTAIRTSDTRYLTDPSIAAAALGLGPDDLLNDLETMGLLFENLVVRDLRVYAEAIDGKVYHYRDKNNLECDAVVHLRNGSYGLIEIKLGGDKRIEEGAKTLAEFDKILDTSKMKSPSFKMIITGIGDYAYQRKDGILIVPIGCLKD
ncbi:MAG: ATP-binding protein [Spirochaetales bacterium]|nr:ATP-binding protein [Spirochaetales bacterium]